ncbi:MAG: trypsin-like peptidase domain-containing protein, partial [Glaciihabitans sp.]
MAHDDNPTDPTPTPADSSDSVAEAARLAAQADSEAARAVEVAAAALSRAAIAKAAADRAAAERATALAAAASAVPAPAGEGVAVRPAWVGPEGAPAAADAVTLQKVFYNATPGAAGAGAAEQPAAGSSFSGGDQPPAKKPMMRTRTAGLLIGGAAAMVIALGGGGFALGATMASSGAQTSSTTLVPDTTDDGAATTPDQSQVPDGSGYAPTSPFGGSGGNTGTDSSTEAALDVTPATDEQTAGVVTIVSTLYYDESTQAAGTGVILTSNGQILTNNHVIDGATSIEVTVESTGKTYDATVVGTDSTNDIALLQLENASGLDTSSTDEATVAVGDEATSIGNAEGTGDLVAAAGVVTATNESITVGNEYTGAQESLSGLIEINADVVSGDSGGPLVDSDGDVIGIVTAASSGSSDITGFAIPISAALDIVDQIESGVETDTVEIGLPAFLGVQLATAQQAAGVTIGGVIAGTAAETAGLAAGDVITAVDGTAVTSSEALSGLIATYEPGDSIVVTYTNAAGASQQVT